MGERGTNHLPQNPDSHRGVLHINVHPKSMGGFDFLFDPEEQILLTGCLFFIIPLEAPWSKAGIYAGQQANPGGGTGDLVIKVTFYAVCSERMGIYCRPGGE
jgi:hypothetical protein